MDKPMNEQPDYRPQMHPAYFEEEVHLRDYIKVLRRRWKVLVFTFAAVFAVTVLYTFGMRPVYEAETLLQVTEGSRTPAILGELAALSTGTNAVET